MNADGKQVPTALYRLLGEGDSRVYIGIAKNFGKRWQQHAHAQPWWPEVRRQTIDWHPDRDSAEAAEQAAIKAEHPKYNLQHNLGAAAPRATSVSPQIQDERRLIGAAVRRLRTEHELSQAAFAALMREKGWPWYQNTVARIERGQTALDFLAAVDFLAMFGLLPSDFSSMVYGDAFPVEGCAA